jgi:hypothetical protein
MDLTDTLKTDYDAAYTRKPHTPSNAQKNGDIT